MNIDKLLALIMWFMWWNWNLNKIYGFDGKTSFLCVYALNHQSSKWFRYK